MLNVLPRTAGREDVSAQLSVCVRECVCVRGHFFPCLGECFGVWESVQTEDRECSGRSCPVHALAED